MRQICRTNWIWSLVFLIFASCSSASVNSYSSSRWWLFRYSSARRSLNALPTTDTLLSVMAAAANIGDNRMPKNG